jgi:cobalamin 5'-phosphate synthase/cobalamin synthase
MNPLIDVARRFVCALAFLTRAPLPPTLRFETADVSRAALFFPVIGALLGGLAAAGRHLLSPHLPPLVTALLLVGIYALATGALHLDGVADMADGFGGGRTRADVLRIMRDHAIGAYGAFALILVVTLHVAAIASLVEPTPAWADRTDRALVVAPVLGRWASIPLGRILPYARLDGGKGTFAGRTGWIEVGGATILAGAAAIGLLGWRGLAAWGAVVAFSTAMGVFCHRRIGGVTGDTLGANIEGSTVLVYLVCLWR